MWGGDARAGLPESDVDLGWRRGPKFLLKKLWVCDTCGTRYRPVVHVGPSIWALALIPLLVIGFFLLFQRFGDHMDEIGLVIFPLVVLMTFLVPRLLAKNAERIKEKAARGRKVHVPESGSRPGPGDIVPRCTSCGSRAGRPDDQLEQPAAQIPE